MNKKSINIINENSLDVSSYLQKLLELKPIEYVGNIRPLK